MKTLIIQCLCASACWCYIHFGKIWPVKVVERKWKRRCDEQSVMMINLQPLSAPVQMKPSGNKDESQLLWWKHYF